MPETNPEVKILFYRDGLEVPAWEFIDAQSDEVRAGFELDLQLLREQGYQLGRPHAAPLGSGLHELRVREGRVHYRVLFFWEGGAAVMTHGFTKEGAVPDRETRRAQRMRREFVADPGEHTAEVE
jgi:phage-related protein